MFVGSFHQIIVTGRIIREVVLRYTAKGVPIVQFSIPTNNVYTVYKEEDQEEVIKETTWFNVSLVKKTAEMMEYTLKKGDHIQIIGRLKPDIKLRTLTDGRTVGDYEVIADQVIFLPNGYRD